MDPNDEVTALKKQNEQLISEVERLTEDKKALILKLTAVKKQVEASYQNYTDTANKWSEDRQNLLDELSRIVNEHNKMVSSSQRKVEEIRKLLRTLDWGKNAGKDRILTAMSDLSNTFKNDKDDKRKFLGGDKLLFIDIGGVFADIYSSKMDTNAFNLLEDIVNETDCKIVLTSDYRRRKDLEKSFRNQLESRGLTKHFLGSTPVLDDCTRRKEEIRLFLDSHRDFSSWAVLDDWPLYNRDKNFEGKVIRTSDGFERSHVKAAVSLLN